MDQNLPLRWRHRHPGFAAAGVSQCSGPSAFGGEIHAAVLERGVQS